MEVKDEHSQSTLDRNSKFPGINHIFQRLFPDRRAAFDG